jgi:hypothetical protein
MPNKTLEIFSDVEKIINQLQEQPDLISGKIRNFSKKKGDLLEKDIFKWLQSNRSLSELQKLKKINSALKELKLSNEFLLDLSAFLCIRVDQAKSVMEKEKTLIPLMALGLKTSRQNRKNASGRRFGGRNAHIQKIQKIMIRYKNDDKTFKEFLYLLLAGSIDGVFIEKHNDGYYKIHHEDHDDKPLKVKETTIRDWYSRK